MKKHWLYRRESIRKLWIGGSIILGLCVLAQLVIPLKPHFGVDGVFGFFAVFGLLSCVAMVLFARLLGIFLKRPDDYYDA